MNTLPTNSLLKLNSTFWIKVCIIAGFILTPQLILMKLHGYDPIIEFLFGKQEFTQHIIGAPVDPRYGLSNEVGQLADFGYDTARDLSRLATVLSSYISTLIAIKIAFKNGFSTFAYSLFLKGLAVQYGIPISVHLFGTFLINNYGGIGGGL